MDKDWLKLAGLTNLGPKGQLLIAKDIREKLGFLPGEKLYVISKKHENIALGLILIDKWPIFYDKLKKSGEKIEDFFIISTVQIGSKGQIIISKEGREYLDITSGDNLACLFLGFENIGMLGILKNSNLEQFINNIGCYRSDMENIFT